jgi:hypothetical protein
MLRPDDTFKLYPDGEGDGNPVLIYRAQSAGYWLDFQRRYRAGESDPDWLETLVDLTSEGLVGWENIEGECNRENFAAKFTMADLLRIALELPTRALLTGLDRKKSERQSP